MHQSLKKSAVVSPHNCFACHRVQGVLICHPEPENSYMLSPVYILLHVLLLLFNKHKTCWPLMAASANIR